MDYEDMKVATAIALTTFAKFLMSEEGPVEGETQIQARFRRRKSFGGIIAGVIIGYFFHEKVIALVPALTEDDRTLVAIVLTVTGEHLFRWIMGFGPDTFGKITRYVFRIPDDKP